MKMARNREIVIFFLSLLISFTYIFQVYAQPKVPKEKISPDIRVDVKIQIEKLYSEDPIERSWGAYYLGQMGEKAAPAIPFLITMLDDDAAQLQWYTKKGPTWYTSPASESSKALVKIGKPAVGPLISVLNNEDENIRKRAAKALGCIEDEQAIKPLINLIDDKSNDIQEAAVWALGEIKAKDVIQPLKGVLLNTQKAQTVRIAAMTALEGLDDDSIIESLLIVSKDSDEGIRTKAALTLAVKKHPAGIESSLAMLKRFKDAFDKSEDTHYLTEAAYIALVFEKISGQHFGVDYTKWQKWWDENKERFGK